MKGCLIQEKLMRNDHTLLMRYKHTDNCVGLGGGGGGQ